jgi:hypothetical protein
MELILLLDSEYIIGININILISRINHNWNQLWEENIIKIDNITIERNKKI